MLLLLQQGALHQLRELPAPAQQASRSKDNILPSGKGRCASLRIGFKPSLVCKTCWLHLLTFFTVEAVC
jgi:hypothetical protein